ncbi:MAG TPA: TolC family protein [Polyangia bacterium]|nr:TolC family protein [Polyangia bacterium]
MISLLAPAVARGADAAEPTVTFAEAIDRALRRNPTVAVALAEIARADALVRQARAGFFPTLAGNGSYTRLDAPRTTLDKTTNQRSVTVEKDQWAGNLTLIVPLLAPPAWGQTLAASDNRRIAEASAADVKRQLATAVGRAYLTVVAQHRIVVVNETARATAQHHYDYAHTRLLGGLGHSIDDVRAAQDLASVEVEQQAGIAGLVRAREALGVLLGESGPVDSTDSVNMPAPPAIDSAIRDARARRTDLKLLDERVAAAHASADRWWTYYAPLLAAVAEPFAQQGSHLVPDSGWQAQLVLTLPLYDGGLRTGITRERDALVEEARANLEAGLRQAASDVRTAYQTLLLADKALVSAQQAVAFAQKALELANLAYEAGATTNIEVIDAARRARDAETAAAQSEDVAHQARLDLLVASGRFP